MDAVESWRRWQVSAAVDPSSAQANKNFFLTNAAVAGLSLIIAALVWYLMRPHGRQGASSA